MRIFDRRFVSGRWMSALLVAAALAGCAGPGASVRREIRATLEGYRQALNGKAFDRLEPLLADEVRVDGMTDELSRAGLRAGMHWPPARIENVQILKISGPPDSPDARVALYSSRGYFVMRFGFDSAGKIRLIEEAPIWKPRGTVLKGDFRSPFVGSNGLMFVEAQVNDRSGYLLLDTGSSDLLLNPKYFSADTRAGMPGVASTVHGLKSAPQRAFVHRLKWGNLVASDIRGQLHGLSQMESPGISPLLGALGFEQFRNCALAFDWKSRTVEVSGGKRPGEGKNPPPRARVGFNYFLHAPVLAAVIGGRAHPMLLDTGSQTNVLPESGPLGAHFRPSAAPTKISDGGRTGESAYPLGVVDETVIGGLAFRDMPFAIFPVPYLAGNGILGSPVLQAGRVEIDYPGRTVSFW
jgi:hypothetical protein